MVTCRHAALQSLRLLSTEATQPLCGSVASHSSYIFLHADQPPSEFPTKVSTAIQRALQLRTMKWGTIVNFAWTGSAPKLTGPHSSATVFSTLGGRLEIPELSLENMDDVETKLKAHIQRGPITVETSEEVHIHVCTHGARDCRCGEHGGQVSRALKEEVERRGLGRQIRVREVGHVGGHKYAANLLVYPHGEWLGHLRPENVPQVLDAILQRPIRPFTNQDPPILADHWRGRMGLGKEEQITFLESYISSRNKHA